MITAAAMAVLSLADVDQLGTVTRSPGGSLRLDQLADVDQLAAATVAWSLDRAGVDSIAAAGWCAASWCVTCDNCGTLACITGGHAFGGCR